VTNLSWKGERSKLASKRRTKSVARRKRELGVVQEQLGDGSGFDTGRVRLHPLVKEKKGVGAPQGKNIEKTTRNSMIQIIRVHTSMGMNRKGGSKIARQKMGTTKERS